LSIPELDSYHYKIPTIVEDPVSTLRHVCSEKLRERNAPHQYWDRLEEELEGFDATGMAGYPAAGRRVH
jgi:hypothetical protein